MAVMLLIPKSNKPDDCPFCGSDAALIDDPIDFDDPNTLRYGYGCSNPDCIIFTGLGVKLFETKEEALTYWNTRYARIVRI